MRLYQLNDYASIYQWCAERGTKAPPAWSLPPTGFIVPKVAVGFLVMTDNECGILDFFISNPQAPAVQKGKSVEKIVKELVQAAKDCGIKMIFCSTEIQSMKKMVMRNGFNHVGKSDYFTLGL